MKTLTNTNSILGGKKKSQVVVIIDDEPKYRILYSSVLKENGYYTTAFGDNAVAVKFINDNMEHIDLLVLDISMAYIEAHSFVEMIRLKHPEAKILIASNYDLEKQKQLIPDANGYFMKFEGFDVFIEKVKEILS